MLWGVVVSQAWNILAIFANVEGWIHGQVIATYRWTDVLLYKHNRDKINNYYLRN
jgi:hypothetical protein